MGWLVASFWLLVELVDSGQWTVDSELVFEEIVFESKAKD